MVMLTKIVLNCFILLSLLFIQYECQV